MGQSICQIINLFKDEYTEAWFRGCSMFINGEESIFYKNAYYANLSKLVCNALIEGIMNKDLSVVTSAYEANDGGCYGLSERLGESILL